MSENCDTILDELKDFSSQEKQVVTPSLKDVIKDISKTGRFRYSWDLLKPLISLELKMAMESFLEQFPPKKSGETDTEKVKELENLKDEILTTLDAFTSAPFTIQRLTELITQPRKHYKTCAKFYRGILKNVLVVSTVDPEDSDEQPAKKIKLDVNGDSSSILDTESYDKLKLSCSPIPNNKHETNHEECTTRDADEDSATAVQGSLQSSGTDEHKTEESDVEQNQSDHDSDIKKDTEASTPQSQTELHAEIRKKETDETKSEDVPEILEQDAKETRAKEDSSRTEEQNPESTEESATSVVEPESHTSQTPENKSTASQEGNVEPMDQS